MEDSPIPSSSIPVVDASKKAGKTSKKVADHSSRIASTSTLPIIPGPHQEDVNSAGTTKKRKNSLAAIETDTPPPRKKNKKQRTREAEDALSPPESESTTIYQDLIIHIEYQQKRLRYTQRSPVPRSRKVRSIILALCTLLSETSPIGKSKAVVQEPAPNSDDASPSSGPSTEPGTLTSSSLSFYTDLATPLSSKAS